MDVFKSLSESFVLTRGDTLLPIHGNSGLGAMVGVFREREAADAIIGKIPEHEDLSFLPVGDPFRLMRRAARECMCGLQVIDHHHKLLEHFMFMVRVEEAGDRFPTILTTITEDGWGASLTRIGVRDIPHGHLLHWKRYDILDRLSGSWDRESPFLGWKQGDPLYELRADNTVVLLAEVPIIGPWIPVDGSYAFFTSEKAAIHYLQYHLADGVSRLLMQGPASELYNVTSADVAPKTNDDNNWPDLSPISVNDLAVRLAELHEIYPLAAWCINPIDARMNTGYGRLYGEGPTSIIRSETGFTPRMVATSGHWSVQAGNIFEMQESLAPWTALDTIRWSGGQEIQLGPLDHTLVNLPVHTDVENMSQADISEWVEKEVLQSEVDVDDILHHELAGEPTDFWESSSRLDAFHFVAWDTVTGMEGVFVFEDVIDALKYLVLEEKMDRSYRVTGVSTENVVGFRGSGDDEFERQRSNRFQIGILRIGERILTKGYKPRDSDNIVSLCNSNMKTLHIECAGYAKDLIWQSGSELTEKICNKLNVKIEIYLKWLENADPTIDSEGKSLVCQRMDYEVWRSLSNKSRSFLATALCDLNRRGPASLHDYAPVSMEIVKALETELGLVLRRFRDQLRGSCPNYSGQKHEEVFKEFICGGRVPALGIMSRLFRKPGPDSSDLIRALHKYLKLNENHEFLTGRKFANKGLNKVIHKYRNSGVHDSHIDYETCMKCLEDLVGTKDKPGFLQQWFLAG